MKISDECQMDIKRALHKSIDKLHKAIEDDDVNDAKDWADIVRDLDHVLRKNDKME